MSSRSSTLHELLKKLNLPSHWIRLIPSFQIWEQAMTIDSAASKSSYVRIISLGSKVINQSLKLLYPGPGYNKFRSELITKLVTKIADDNVTKKKAIVGDKATPSDTTMNSFKQTSSEKLDSAVSTLCKWSNISKKRSIERHVIRAILTDSFLRHEIKEMKNGPYQLKLGNGQPLAQAQQDGMKLRVGKQINLKSITQQYKADVTIHKGVDFILCDKNVSTVSWGSKTVLSQSIGDITLPKLTRKCDVIQMYRTYQELTFGDDEQLKSTTFYKICNILTTNDEVMLKSIDYVSGLLANETCETLQDIVDRLLPKEHCNECTKYISVAKNFMKNQFKCQLMQEDDYCFHSLQYAKCKELLLRENTNDNACKFPFFLCNYMKSIITDGDV